MLDSFNAIMLQQPHWKLCQNKTYVDAIEQNAFSRRVSGGGGGGGGTGAIGGGRMVHRLDFDLGLHPLATAADDGGGSGE